jgi:uncharacterized membrane protein (DUF485 family)
MKKLSYWQWEGSGKGKTMDILVRIIIVGIGATLCLDVWSFILKQLNVKSLDYRFVGRWLGYFPQGKFFHQNIMTAVPVKNETLIGWTAHYCIGISFAGLLVLTYGSRWLNEPTIFPAVTVGIATVVAPLFIMQPAFGFGIASSKLPHSNLLRVKSVVTHSVFGIGLFVTAWLLSEMRWFV